MAQGLHFTYHEFAPVSLSPALIGDFEGTARLAGVVRDQGRSIAGSGAYSNVTLGVDINLPFGFRKQDWISGAIVMNAYDRAGAGKQGETGQHIGLAYHLGLNGSNKSYLTIGAKFINASKKISAEGLNFISDVSGQTSQFIRDTEYLDMTESDITGGYRDLEMGVAIKLANKANYNKFGFSIGNILNNDRSIGSSGQGNTGGDDLGLSIVGFYEGRFLMNKTTDFKPALLFRNMGVYKEFQMHGTVGYLINPEKELVLRGGLGARIASSSDVQILLGAEIKDISVGLSYDLNISGLNKATNTFGGLELGLIYIFKYYPKPKIKPVILCPRL